MTGIMSKRPDITLNLTFPLDSIAIFQLFPAHTQRWKASVWNSCDVKYIIYDTTVTSSTDTYTHKMPLGVEETSRGIRARKPGLIGFHAKRVCLTSSDRLGKRARRRAWRAGRGRGPTWGFQGPTPADCQSPGNSVTKGRAWRKDKPQINSPSKNTGRNLRQTSCNVYRRM